MRCASRLKFTVLRICPGRRKCTELPHLVYHTVNIRYDSCHNRQTRLFHFILTFVLHQVKLVNVLFLFQSLLFLT